MAAVLIRPDPRLGRGRLLVLQVLMISLFLTLLARLWFVQVISGEEYQARAAEQSVRDVVVQPARGLIVDTMGRPLVANRTSWMISADRTLLGRLATDQRDRVLTAVAGLLDEPVTTLQARLRLCGTTGAEPGTCWNGSPHQPVPLARGVKQAVAMRIAEQAEEYPGILADTESVRAYPAPYGANAAGVLGYLSPISGDELERAKQEGDVTLNGASVVGRAGVERSYDAWLRGVPGHDRVTVNAVGQTLRHDAGVAPIPGNTLVTTLDAKLQAYVEEELATTIAQARATRDTVTGRHYEADSGAVVVLDARDASVLAMASAPGYDPAVWVGGITPKQLGRLYDEDSGSPLVSRATQGQLAPGSTWKPFMTIAALSNGYREDTRLGCPGGLQVGNRWVRNYQSAAYGVIDFARALELSCDTFFYQIAIDYWRRGGADAEDVDAPDPLVDQAKQFGFGEPTGIDVAGEAAGRIADRPWKHQYWEAMKDHYCRIDAKNTAGARDFQHLFAKEFCAEGYAYRVGDAVNFVIGQGDTMVTPLQLARAYVALANGGKLYRPRVARAIVDPDGHVVKRFTPVLERRIDAKRSAFAYVDRALAGTTRTGTLAWRFAGFPLDEVNVRGKTGTAEVQGKQTTSWLATYSDDYVVVMMVTQAGTGSGTSGPAMRRIWERLYGIEGTQVRRARAIIPGARPPQRLPIFADDGTILPPSAPNPGRTRGER